MKDNVAERKDWNIEDMPQENATFTLKRKFSDEQMERLRMGHIPQEMEDKWFWYMEGNKLYAHRSWTGICIYTIEFGDGEEHIVTVNGDGNQYSRQSNEEELVRINSFLDWWSEPSYDYYNEWLSETADMLKENNGN